jgi:hypothetical protein
MSMLSQLLALTLLLGLAACGGTAAAGPAAAEADLQSPALSIPPRLTARQGKNPMIVDPSGKQILLRSYNWGAWNTAQAGDAAASKAAGANAVRIPLRWWGNWKNDPYGNPIDSRNESYKDHLDPDHVKILKAMIDQAVAQKLWVVLFVDSNYGQGAQGSTDNFWTDAKMKGEFKEVWTSLVNQFGGYQYIGAWEILPEPNPPDASDTDVRAFYEEMIGVIRQVDKKTPIVIGPNNGYDLKRLNGDIYTEVDTNIIYTGDYFIFPNQTSLANPLDRVPYLTGFQSTWQAPVWVNQVGTESGTDLVDNKSPQIVAAKTLLDTLNTDKIGWSWWTYRIDTSNDQVHGIYYTNPNETNPDAKDFWLVKPNWLSLLNAELPQ